MMEYTLHIGDVVTSCGNTHYTCLGLGSCIGLFIHDRLSKLSAGAHILLPEDEKGPGGHMKYYNVASALKEILDQLRSKGSNLESLRAKITGGANVLAMDASMGSRNVNSVLKHLTANKIYVAAADVGGIYSRTAKFESSTGMLTIKMTELNEYKIL